MMKNPFIAVLFGLSLIFILTAAVVSSVGLYNTEGPFVIHFDASGEADFIGGSSNAFNIIVISMVILFINFILALKVYDRERFLSYIFSGISLFVTSSTLIAAGLISSLN